MKKYLSTIVGTLIALTAIGSIVYTSKDSCIGYEMRIPVSTEFTWCLDKDEYKEAKDLLLQKVKDQGGYDSERAMALVRKDKSFAKTIAKELIAQYEVQGFVEIDNYILHNYILQLHFEDLKNAKNLPTWLTNKAELTNEGKILKIHDSLKSNLD